MNRMILATLALLLCAGLAGCGASPAVTAAVGAAGLTQQLPAATPVSRAPADTTPTADDAPLTWEEVAERFSRSVVMVRATFPETMMFFEGQGSGSGVVFGDGSLILTNAHVVQGAGTITVAATGDMHQRPADLVGISIFDDLAVLKIDNAVGLSPAPLGSERPLRPGQEVAAFGYPLGDMLGIDFTMTRGIISKANTVIDGLTYEALIQTDTPITPGNSGGPLVNSYGEVVGITSLGSYTPEIQNINFAINVTALRTTIDSLQEGNDRLSLGMSLAETYDGVVIVDALFSGGAASRLGVLPGDTLLKLEGMRVTSLLDIYRILRSRSEGDHVRIELSRTTEKAQQVLVGEIAIGDPEGGLPLTVLHEELFEQPEEESEMPVEPQGVSVWTFTDDDGSWPAGYGPWGDAAVVDGAYHLQAYGEAAALIAAPADPWNTAQLVLATVTLGETGRAGIALGAPTRDGLGSAVACWVDANGSAGCSSFVDGVSTPLGEPVTLEGVGAHVPTRLVLTSDGLSVTFLVNGVAVATTSDAQALAGMPALYFEAGEAGGTASFDDVVVVAQSL